VCTLSPNLMAGRLAEFEALFANRLLAVERAPLLLRLVFDVDDAQERAVRDLFAREQQCCAFYSLAYVRQGGRLVVEISVPAQAGPTLDGLQALAARSGAHAPAAAGR
jgi:hypothetical protein